MALKSEAPRLANIRSILLARESGEWYAEEYDLPLVTLTDFQKRDMRRKYGTARNIAPITGRMMAEIYAVVWTDPATGREVAVGIPPIPEVFKPMSQLGIFPDEKAETISVSPNSEIFILILDANTGIPGEFVILETGEGEDKVSVTTFSKVIESNLIDAGKVLNVMRVGEYVDVGGVHIEGVDFVAFVQKD
jgi:hypothetical protein